MNVLVTASNSRISVAAVGDITKTEKNLLLDIQNDKKEKKKTLKKL